MGRKIFRTGNSAVVSLPPEVLELLDLQPGDEVNVVADPDRQRILVMPTGVGSTEEPRESALRVAELVERYGPALERLAEIETRGQAPAAHGIDADVLQRARALRQDFAARHGVLSLDLVTAARTDLQARRTLAQDEDGEGQRHESRA